MPCCTLTAFLLSQLGIAVGAIKVRLFGGSDFSSVMPASVCTVFARWRWAGMAIAFGVELSLVGAVAPYIFTRPGHVEGANFFASAWHICSMGASLAGDVAHQASR
ncbi:MAG: hypothetical protein ACLQUZ_01655 [Rhizomicrobium sp.]